MDIRDLSLRVLKITGAVILMLLAIGNVIYEFQLIHRHASASWHVHLGAILFVALCVCASYLLLQPKVDQPDLIYCPKCKAVGRHVIAPRYTRSISPAAWHFGGVFLSVLYSGSREERFRCRECGEFFHSHTRKSRGYQILFLLLVALIANRFWSELSEFSRQGDYVP